MESSSNSLLWVSLLCFSFLSGTSKGSAGDQDSNFRLCTEQCRETGCVNLNCVESCQPVTVNGKDKNFSRYLELSWLTRWQMWDCGSECKYQCMMQRELTRHLEGNLPVQYYGKWPFKRLLGLQEPASVIFSIANLAMHLERWISFLNLIFNKLPRKCQGKYSPYYEYSSLWIIYGILVINSWFWSTIFHSRDVVITERMDYLSAVSVIGYTLIVSIIRTMNVTAEAARVLVASPIIAFVATHILYLSFVTFDYGLNMQICVVMGLLQLVMWTLWGWFAHHPARYKLWFVVVAGAAAMLLEVFDFPPVWGLFDAHSLWHAATIPLACFWWSFIKDDAVFRTSDLTNTVKGVEGQKKVR